MSEPRIRILKMLEENKIVAAEAGRLLEAIAGLEPDMDSIAKERFPNAQGAILKRSKIDDAGLEGAILEGADLSGADLRGADFFGTNLTNANVRDANLQGADLTAAKCERANLEGADLSTANLNHTNFRGAHLPRADLSGAELAGADLEGLAYPGLDLAGMDLTGLKTHQKDRQGTGDVSFLQLRQVPAGEHTAGGIGHYTEAAQVERPVKDCDELCIVIAGAFVIRVDGQLYLFRAGDAFVIHAGRTRECVAIVDEMVVAWADL